MAEEQQPIISKQDAPPMPAHSLPQDTHVMSPPAASMAYSSALPTHLPSPAQAPSNVVDPVRFTTLKGMVNQLAANMNTNMTELMAMLRDQNRASSSHTPFPERRTTVHLNLVDPPIYVTDSEDISFSAMTYVPAVSPVSDPMPPPPAPTSVPFPPAAFLSTDSAMLTLPPLTIPTQPPIYTVPPLTVPPVTITQAPAPTAEHFSFQAPQPQMSFTYQAPLPLNIPPTEPGTPTHAAPAVLPTNIPSENEQEKRMKRMEETIRALQADLSQKFLDQYRFCVETPPTLLDLSMTEMRESQTFEAYATEWRGKAAKHIPPIIEQVQLLHSTLRGAYYSHLLAHTSSFSDMIEAGKKLDMGVKLGRIEGSSRKKDGETSKKQTAGTSRRGKDATIGIVNFGHQASQPISVDYTPALPTSQAYAHPVHYVQPYQMPQAYFPTSPTVIQSQPPQQYPPVQVQQARPPASRSPQPAQRSFLQATRSEQKHSVPISILPCITKICAVSFIRVLLVTLWILAGDSEIKSKRLLIQDRSPLMRRSRRMSVQTLFLIMDQVQDLLLT
ncbi:hypothetical protein CRG98_023513 [Punica granatum]|uniref:Extensin-like n=1 Tax=Punica granatum TaxID=22663 RepID=A0A2I0JIK9_PUNGR|nr:hypothetical protein CRG98_023513 [Punica granatum]